MPSPQPASPLAPRLCPQCSAEVSFTILADKIACRRCGFVLRGADGRPIQPPQTASRGGFTPQIAPRQPLMPSYRITTRGEINHWARAAFDTAQDYIRQQNWEEAVKAFYRAIEYQKDFLDPHLWIARISSDPKVRHDHLTTVLAYEPNHLEALRELMVMRGDLDANAPAPDSAPGPQLRPAGGAVDAQTANVRCPRCGGLAMQADELTALPVCDACGYVDEARRVARAPDAILTMALLKRWAQPVIWQVGERLLRCNSCGAERAIPARKLSAHCPFCGSKHVIETDALRSFQQPDVIAPFSIARDDAGTRIKARLRAWTERVRSWVNDARVQRATLEGVYLPFWIFDASVEVRRTVIRETMTMSWSADVRTQALPAYETGTLTDSIHDVAVCAVTSPPPLLTSRLGRWNLGEAVPYEPRLLAQYPAELYSIDFDKASLEARAIIGREMRARHALGTGQGAQENIFTAVTQMHLRLALLPVWVGTLYETDGDVRSALVNGQTGHVALGKPHKPRSQP